MTMATKISRLAGIAILLLTAGVTETRAERPLSIVVGYAAGGTTDTIARIIGRDFRKNSDAPSSLRIRLEQLVRSAPVM